MENQDTEFLKLEQELAPNERALMMSFMTILNQKRVAELDAQEATKAATMQLQGALITLVNLHGLDGQWALNGDCSKLIRKG